MELWSVIPRAVGVQRVKYSILDGGVVNCQVGVNRQKILTEQREDCRRQGPHLNIKTTNITQLLTSFEQSQMLQIMTKALVSRRILFFNQQRALINNPTDFYFPLFKANNGALKNKEQLELFVLNWNLVVTCLV